jgi:hypothetical protein
MNTRRPPAPRLTRRDFLTRAGIAAAGLAVTSGTLSKAQAQPTPSAPPVSSATPRFEIAAFEKHFFEKYTPGQIAQTCDEMDLHLELTVRPEGHVKPENVPDELPPLVEALARHNRRILILATSFVRPDDPHLEKVLRTARSLGIRHYRHRGFGYKEGQPIKAQIAGFRSQAREFAAINAAIGITGLYQNHAGAGYVGAAIWDIDAVLDDISPQHFGLALDTRHLLVELGRAWPTAVQLIAPRVASLFVKSFRWDRDRTIETPLSEGIVTQKLIAQIVAGHAQLPVCLHVEHLPLKPVPFDQRTATVEAFRRDAEVLHGWLAAT